MSNIKEYLKLMRIKHYFKNILIFLPLFFSGELFNISKIGCCLIGFIVFSLIASFVYIVNDIRDIENDRKHPVKKNRPLASGKISKKHGIIFAIVLICFAYILNTIMFLVKIVPINGYIMSSIFITLYILINIAYSFGLKKQPIIDVVILVLGFLIRILYGSAITNIEVSNLLYLTVIAGSFYMGFGKRRNEIIKQGDTSRAVLKRYNKEFLDKNMYVCLTLSIVFYALWCVNANTIARMGNNLMAWTVPIVMIILMKYSLDVEGDSFGDPVDVLFKDKILMLLVILFAIIVFSIMYI